MEAKHAMRVLADSHQFKPNWVMEWQFDHPAGVAGGVCSDVEEEYT